MKKTNGSIEKINAQLIAAKNGKWISTIDYDVLPHDTPLDEARSFLGKLPENWSLEGLFTDNKKKLTSLSFETNEYKRTISVLRGNKMNQNITEYLVPNDVAKWAKEKGFDGECERFFNYFMQCENRHVTTQNSGLSREESYSVPTFDQFFDWVEEKWNRTIRIEYAEDDTWYFEGGNYASKRKARIEACKAIIKYVDEKQPHTQHCFNT